MGNPLAKPADPLLPYDYMNALTAQAAKCIELMDIIRKDHPDRSDYYRHMVITADGMKHLGDAVVSFRLLRSDIHFHVVLLGKEDTPINYLVLSFDATFPTVVTHIFRNAPPPRPHIGVEPLDSKED